MSATVAAPIGHRAFRQGAPRPLAPTAVTADAAQQAPRSAKLKLTRRGRIVLTTLAAAPLVALALFFGLSAGSAVATSAESATSFDYVTVESGQSLWQLAESIAPDSDPRDVIAEIVSLNQLSSSTVVPGQELAVPAAYTLD